MKKLLLLAALVGVAFTSCVKNEEHGSADAKQQITFEPAKYKASAGRANEVVFPQQETFGAFAYYRTTAVASEDHSTFMDNVKISYVAAATPYWGSEELYYWPESQGTHLDFISYYPYNEDKTAAGVPQISMSDQQQTMQYVNYTVTDNTDLMYSDKAMNQTRNTLHYNFTGVPTLFRHALAKLNFKVKVTMMNNAATSPDNVTNWTVAIKKITLNNIYNTGSVTLKTVNIHDGGATTVQWSNATTAAHNVWNNTSATITKEWAYDQVLTTTATIYGAGDNLAENYFVLPQAFVEAGQSITVDYEVKTKAGSGHEGVAEKTKTVHFINYPAVAAWEMGKNITYTLQIDPEGDVIHFAPAIVDWETGDGVIDL